MKSKQFPEYPTVLHRMHADQQALNECIRKGGDIKKVADERGIKLATPIKASFRVLSSEELEEIRVPHYPFLA